MSRTKMIYIILFLFSIFVSYFVGDIAASTFVMFYAAYQGVELKTLSEDYFMGFISIIIHFSIFLISSICMFVFILRKTKRYSITVNKEEK